MSVSKERLDQIRELSNDERVDRLDTNAFDDADWERLDAELTAETIEFCRSTTDPEELHAFAATWNWDKGMWGLEEILANRSCEAATALLIYWSGGPEWFLKYPDRQAVEADAGHSLDGFDFLVGLEARYVAGEFRPGRIAFDPTDPADSPSGLSYVGQYDDLRDKFVRALPPAMYAPVKPQL